MSGLHDHIAFLSQDIGPRPAGTEEEQQAALYITEHMQKEAGLSAVIEDFNSESNEETPKAICTFITLVFTIAAFFFPVMAIPALIASSVAALVFVLETLDKPVISKLLARGVSQNVVAKYDPGYSPETGGSRRRKIVLVAHYDSGKVHPELNSPFLGVLPILRKITFGAMIFVPALLLVRYLFFLHASGAVAIVLNIITVVALLLVSPPFIFAIIHKFSPYNEAANCNAAGVAVLLETARKIGRGRASGQTGAAMDADAVSIYGEERARAAGLVPEGAQLVYEAARMQAPEPIPQTEEERLVAAKAAIAAMTGRAVPHAEKSSIADNLVQIREMPVGIPSEQQIQEQREETREAFSCIPSETIRSAQEKAHLAAPAPEETEAGVPFEEGEIITIQQQTGEEAERLPFDESSQADQATYVDQREPSIPDWFKKAQENAKKPKDMPSKIQRSQYADALDAAMAESSTHFNQANYAVNAETEERIRKMRDGIMEVSAPHLARESLEAQRTHGIPADRLPETQQGQSGSADRSIRSDEGFAPGDEGRTRFSEMPGSTISMPPVNIDELRSGVPQEQPASVPAQYPDTPGEFPGAPGNSAGICGPESLTANQGPRKRPIVLPDITAQTANITPIPGTGKQRAPLAAAEESSQTTAKSLLNMLPSIGPTDLPQTGTADAQGPGAPTGDRSDLRNTLPSLSGALRAQVEQESSQSAGRSGSGTTGSVSAAGSFAAAGATGSFAPVGDELLDDVDPDDIYVEDADDSAYDSNYTETGAFAGPGYVEMPKSRARRFFDKFRREKDDDSVSTQQWLDVDEGFEARSAGAARGGWESFQPGVDDEGPAPSSPEHDSLHEESSGDRGDEPRKNRRRADRDTWEGGAFSRRSVQADVEDSRALDYGATSYRPVEPSQRSDEFRQIQQFRNPGFDTEIWFVALGSELANNGGIRAFLAEHGHDLRGSIIINLVGMGSGDLSYLEKEGAGKAGASSRMKRYVSKASQALGHHVGPASIRWKESAATISSKRGFQSMSLVGMYGSMPSRYAQGDDVLENIEEEVLHANADFVMELIKNI